MHLIVIQDIRVRIPVITFLISSEILRWELIAGVSQMAWHRNPMRIRPPNLRRAGMYPRAVSGKLATSAIFYFLHLRVSMRVMQLVSKTGMEQVRAL